MTALVVIARYGGICDTGVSITTVALAPGSVAYTARNSTARQYQAFYHSHALGPAAYTHSARIPRLISKSTCLVSKPWLSLLLLLLLSLH